MRSHISIATILAIAFSAALLLERQRGRASQSMLAVR
jgi:hypothetical protein